MVAHIMSRHESIVEAMMETELEYTAMKRDRAVIATLTVKERGIAGCMSSASNMPQQQEALVVHIASDLAA